MERQCACCGVERKLDQPWVIVTFTTNPDSHLWYCPDCSTVMFTALISKTEAHHAMDQKASPLPVF